MKKVLFFLIASAVVAISCTVDPKNIDEPAIDEPTVEGVKFSLDVVTTKTVADGLSTKWVAGDRINVFNAPQNGVFTSQGAFEISAENLASNKFEGTINPLEADAYNWVAVYPYAEANTDLSALTLTIAGAEAALATTPALAGENIPLLGAASNVAKDEAVSIMMGHLVSGIAVTVENAKTSAVSVSEITLTFPTAVAGEFTVNASDLDNIAYTAAASASNTITLKAAEAVTIAGGASATFYAPLAPVTVAGDTGIAYTINGEAGTLTKAENFVFAAGKIKPVTVTIAEQAPSFLPDATRPIYIFGDLNGWNEGDVSSMFPMFKDSSDANDYVYKYTGYLPRGSFKFIPEVMTATGTYYAYCLDEANSKLTFDTTGLGVAFWNEEAGFKQITIDVKNLTYSISAYDASSVTVWNTMGVIGTINGWGTDWDMYTISAENNHIWILDNAEIGVGADGYHCVKFRAEDDWAYSWQKNATPDWETPFGLMTNTPGAADRNIYFGANAGKYKFVFNDISCHYWVLAK